MELLTKGGSNNTKELAALTATMLSLSSVRARELQQLDTKYTTLLTNKREVNRRHVRNERKKKLQKSAVGKLAARVAWGLSNASSTSSSSPSRSSSWSPSTRHLKRRERARRWMNLLPRLRNRLLLSPLPGKKLESRNLSLVGL